MQAVVIGSDGQPWTVQIDAKTGEVFASGLSSAMAEHADGGLDEDSEGSDG